VLPLQQNSVRSSAGGFPCSGVTDPGFKSCEQHQSNPIYFSVFVQIWHHSWAATQITPMLLVAGARQILSVAIRLSGPAQFSLPSFQFSEIPASVWILHNSYLSNGNSK
jgi:hypothetical protein